MTDVRISGSPTADEVAAVLAALVRQPPMNDGRASGYERWRVARLAALRSSRGR